MVIGIDILTRNLSTPADVTERLLVCMSQSSSGGRQNLLTSNCGRSTQQLTFLIYDGYERQKPGKIKLAAMVDSRSFCCKCNEKNENSGMRVLFMIAWCIRCPVCSYAKLNRENAAAELIHLPPNAYPPMQPEPCKRKPKDPWLIGRGIGRGVGLIRRIASNGNNRLRRPDLEDAITDKNRGLLRTKSEPAVLLCVEAVGVNDVDAEGVVGIHRLTIGGNG